MAVIARLQWFAEYRSLLELKSHLDAAREGMLEGRYRFDWQPVSAEADQECMLSILNEWYEVLRSNLARIPDGIRVLGRR
ncbi:hypothetical protein, partial [Rhizobium johnstonii]|uniref:hypothetical protein n=1 Tax=Rhizobium johnstonii TaxID=3019933 RepID=UPI003F9534ED